MSGSFEQELQNVEPLFGIEFLLQYILATLRQHNATHMQNHEGRILLSIDTITTETIDSGSAIEQEESSKTEIPCNESEDNAACNTSDTPRYAHPQSRSVTPTHSETNISEEKSENAEAEVASKKEWEDDWASVQLDAGDYILLSRAFWDGLPNVLSVGIIEKNSEHSSCCDQMGPAVERHPQTWQPMARSPPNDLKCVLLGTKKSPCLRAFCLCELSSVISNPQ